jgi:hypothetical protein
MTFDPATISTAMNSSHQKNGNGNRPVVAMPNGGILQARKYGGPKTGQSSSAPRAQTPGRDGGLTPSWAGKVSRPKSPARTPASRSRDIVQEVYDRMGVNYVRGQSTFEFDDSKSSISIHSGTKSVTKSPSRNRADLRYMYNSNTQETVESDAHSVRSSFSSTNRGSRWSSSRSVSTNVEANSHPVVAIPPSAKSGSTSIYREDGSFPSTPRKQQQMPSYLVDNRDDCDGTDDRNDIHNFEDREVREDQRDRCSSPLSIKSRISVFSGHGATGGKSPVITKKPFAASPVSQKIYAAEHMNNNKAKVSSLKIDTSGQKVDRQPTTPSQRSLKSGIANNFLAAINKQSNSAPVDKQNSVVAGRPSDMSTKSVPAEIMPSGPNNPDADEQSIAASSVSGEDFAAGTFKHDSSFEKSTGLKCRNEVGSSLTNEMIDELIEQKLQSKLGELHQILEARISQVERAATIRLDEMESKLNQLTNDQYESNAKVEEPHGTEESTTKSAITEPSYYRPFRR